MRTKKYKRSLGTKSQIRISEVQRAKVKKLCDIWQCTYDDVICMLLRYIEATLDVTDPRLVDYAAVYSCKREFGIGYD